ncbi:MAG TPA: L-threonylcarbamoyladenylate synthase [Acidimicrobiales bacterium]|nr:L-threonylcarbamoyladenylate synthase [Acidimicrobiales bacterium]
MTFRVTLDEALALLGEGRVVAVPTDTVYGVAASLERPDALDALFALKLRPASVALPVLVESIEQIESLGVHVATRARSLAAAWWPGALTIIVSVPDALARRVGSTTRSVGFRVPDDALLRSLLARSGPLAVSSANEHGHAPCHSAEEVLEALGSRDELAGVLDDGPRVGQVSTVVDLSRGRWRVVRLGAIEVEELTRTLGEDVAE